MPGARLARQSRYLRPAAAVWLVLASSPACATQRPDGPPPADAPAGASGSAESDDELAIASLPVIPPGLNRAYALRAESSKRISAVYRFSVRAPALAAREWVTFIPRPPDLPGQRVVSVSVTPAGEAVRDLGPLARPLLRSRVRADSPELAKGVAIELRVEAELFSRRLVARGAGAPGEDVKSLLRDERLAALRPTAQFDYGSPGVLKWLDANGLRRGAREGEVDLARRVFQVIVNSFRYEYRGEQDRAASSVAAAGWSDCGGMATLFAAALRSQGVPARMLAGRWAKSARPGERVEDVRYYQEHVKAEFYAQGVGWVPADLSSAVLHDKSRAKLRYFGSDDGDFLTFHVDADLVLDTVHFGRKTIPYLQKPAYWATGTGGFEGAVVSEDWTVR